MFEGPYRDACIKIDREIYASLTGDGINDEARCHDAIIDVFKLAERALVENRTLVVTVDQQREMLSE